jgi:hypothetical protein
MGMNKLPPTSNIFLFIEDQSYANYLLNDVTPVTINFTILVPVVAGEIKDACIILHLPYLKNTAGSVNAINGGKLKIYNNTLSSWHDVDNFSGHMIELIASDAVHGGVIRIYNYWYTLGLPDHEVKDFISSGGTIALQLENLNCSTTSILLRHPFIEVILQAS